MKCIIIYFSQTGNTEVIAKAIQKGVKQAVVLCDIVKIQDANPQRLYEYDLIGLGSPVWGDAPGNVKAFINNMRFVGGKHIFLFSTHGSLPEYFFPSILPGIKRRGLVVIGTRDWYCNCTLYHHVEPYPSTGHPDKVDLKEAEDFGREIAERSRRISAGATNLIPPELPAPPPLAREWAEGYKRIKMFPTLIKFHKKKCLYPKCRLCMDNCPMVGIDLTVKPPVIAKPCNNCEWCARICPTGAIDILDWLKLGTKERGKGANSMLIALFEKAEAEGRFRWLIPKEAVGKVQSYKLHKKHPQWIIGKGLQPPDSYTE